MCINERPLGRCDAKVCLKIVIHPAGANIAGLLDIAGGGDYDLGVTISGAFL